MALSDLISRLDRVKRTGQRRWLARCPAHEDRSPSLGVREIEDGRVLVHCFAGCEVEAVLTAVGLNFDALFPDHIEYGKHERKPFPASDVLRAIVHETTIVAVAAFNVRRGIALSDQDCERLTVAAERLLAAGRLDHG